MVEVVVVRDVRAPEDAAEDGGDRGLAARRQRHLGGGHARKRADGGEEELEEPCQRAEAPAVRVAERALGVEVGAARQRADERPQSEEEDEDEERAREEAGGAQGTSRRRRRRRCSQKAAAASEVGRTDVR